MMAFYPGRVVLHHFDVETSHTWNHARKVFVRLLRCDQLRWLETQERRMDFAD